MKYNKKNNRKSWFASTLNILLHIRGFLYIFLDFILKNPYIYIISFFILYFFLSSEPSLCCDGSSSGDMPSQESLAYVEGLDSKPNNEKVEHNITQGEDTGVAIHKDVSMYRRSYVENSKYNLKGWSTRDYHIDKNTVYPITGKPGDLAWDGDTVMFKLEDGALAKAKYLREQYTISLSEGESTGASLYSYIEPKTGKTSYISNIQLGLKIPTASQMQDKNIFPSVAPKNTSENMNRMLYNKIELARHAGWKETLEKINPKRLHDKGETSESKRVKPV